jgi:ABC-2 type transport system permease protein
VTELVGAEFLKLRTTRGWIGFVVALVLLSAIYAAVLAGGAAAFRVDDAEFQRDLVSSSVVAGLIALLVGISSVTAEWRHGTITRTFLAMPRRGRVLLAKGVAALISGAVLAVLGTVVVLAIAIPVLTDEGGSFSLDGEMFGRIGRVVLAAALWGALGVGVGALLKSQTFALTAAIVWVIFAEELLAALLGLADVEWAGDLLPGRALGSLDGSVDDAVSPLAGGALSVFYVALFGALGYLRVARSDVT